MMKKTFFILPTFTLLLLFIFSFSKREEINWLDHKFIAHATGGIENKVYTNSVESFEENYKKGFRLFEIDFLLTSDESVVARHSWIDTYGQNVSIDDLPLSYDDFLNKKYYGRFTPMDFKMVVRLMEQYSDVFVIIDGKTQSVDDTRALYKQIGKEIENIDKKILRRFIPQMFYEEDLQIIRKLGFSELLYVVGREEYTYQSISDYCMENNIKAVSLSRGRTNKEFVDILSENKVFTYMYTLNEPEEINKYFNLGVHGVFSDFILSESEL